MCFASTTCLYYFLSKKALFALSGYVNLLFKKAWLKESKPIAWETELQTHAYWAYMHIYI